LFCSINNGEETQEGEEAEKEKVEVTVGKIERYRRIFVGMKTFSAKF
jgi:hypothetical protein